MIAYWKVGDIMAAYYVNHRMVLVVWRVTGKTLWLRKR